MTASRPDGPYSRSATIYLTQGTDCSILCLMVIVTVVIGFGVIVFVVCNAVQFVTDSLREQPLDDLAVGKLCDVLLLRETLSWSLCHV